jgi:hypothetical protein
MTDEELRTVLASLWAQSTTLKPSIIGFAAIPRTSTVCERTPPASVATPPNCTPATTNS